MPDKLTMPSLREAMWSSSPNPNATLDDVLKAVAPTGSVAGIAYTTAGAHAITSISEGKLHSSDGDVEQALIYELRLWEVGITDDREVLAHEWRWVNGSGSAEIIVHETSSRKENTLKFKPCWYRHNAYLQHGAALPGNPKTMTSIEVFTEQEYGNTVFVDELMTGKWGRHAGQD
ncbi:hypothetical protein [Arachnia propionica]|jgi:hypothetical protein avisC_11515|uniref:hypothetical protein n=1 Tax=Arachnia propionica TaxID=1750 RepID=UPI000F6EB8AF|nr:hypothetical protein [Arachnia propionica]VEJ59015.1 Uncharacterised protein [Arachnia propionica]